MSALVFDPKKDALTARVTAADLPPEGPVFVVCLTAPDIESRRRLYELLSLAEKQDFGLWLQLITYYGEPDHPRGLVAKKQGARQSKRQRPAQELLPL